MTDEERLYKLDNGSDTARWAAEEIRRLRTKNAELNRRSQLAESAVAKFKKQWDEAGGPKGGNFGRALLASECSRLEQELSELREFKERAETQEPMCWALVMGVGHVAECFDSEEEGADVLVDHGNSGDRLVPLYRHPVSPEGWKMVPVEPTDEMVTEGAEAVSWQNYCDDAKRAYKAMLSAAPEV